MRTLVIHAGGVGDLLLACPAIATLARHAPVTVAGIPERAALAVAGGAAERAHGLDAIDFASAFHAPSDRLRVFLASFERAVIWMRDAAPAAEAFRACGVRDAAWFPGLPPEDWDRHASAYYLDCLGIDAAPPFRLGVPAQDVPDVIIHPGSGGRGKNWPREGFRRVAAALRAEGFSVGWCLGPAEAGWILPAGARLVTGESLVALAGKLAGARAYLGNDSGVAHLAAASGCPTAAIFGPTDPRVWAPLGDHVTVLRGEPWPDEAAVLESLRAMLALPGRG